MKYLAPVALVTAGLLYFALRPRRRIPRWFRSERSLREEGRRE